MTTLPASRDGLPNFCGAEDVVAEAIAHGRGRPIFLGENGIGIVLAWSGNECRVDILDRGPGIDRSIADRLGEPFVSSDMRWRRRWPCRTRSCVPGLSSWRQRIAIGDPGFGRILATA